MYVKIVVGKKNKTSVGAETYYICKHPNPMKVSLKYKISSNNSTDRVLMRGKEKQLGLNPTKHKCLMYSELRK